MNGYVQCVLIGVAATAVMAAAAATPQDSRRNPSYDGRYAFARLRYTENEGDACTCPVNEGPPFGWQHDWPKVDRDLMRIAADVTSLNARTDSVATFYPDDPQLMKYPVAYLTEPGCWHPSESQVRAFRTYLLKGGFFIVDDFTLCYGGEDRYQMSWKEFVEQIHRILPDAKLVPLDFRDPALNVFFKLDPEALKQSLEGREGGGFETAGEPQVYGIYDRNDPRRRLLVMVNYNDNLHISWAYEAKGASVVKHGNDAFKLGVNEVFYGFTH